MKEIIIRPAEIKDAVGIATIHVQTWQHAYKGLMPESYLNSLSIEKRTKRWTENLTSPDPKVTVFVAEENNQVVGFCSIGPSRDEGVSKITGELYAIYIAVNQMGRGIGTALMQKGLEKLKADGFANATLWVLDSNTPTIKFYENKDWKLEGKTKIDVRDGFELHEVRYKIDL